MQVMFQIRADVDRYPGGDFIQLLKTREHLERYGVRTAISFSFSEDLRDYDIVHLFNVTRITDSYLFFLNAQAQGKRVVISPIFHSLRQMGKFYRWYYKVPLIPIVGYLSMKEMFYSLRSRTKVSWRSIALYRNTVRKVLSESDMVLPNSWGEMMAIEQELRVKNKYKIIPNAADFDVSEDNATSMRENIIVHIGRVEPRKNQISVINAYDRIKEDLPGDTRLVFVGSLNESHPVYVNKFLKLVEARKGKISYLGKQPHEGVAALLRRARLLVLPSFFETTGLVGLEALFHGANVVMTDCGYTEAYYAKAVLFCNPYSLESVSSRMLEGFNHRGMPCIEDIRRLRDECSWENAARLTLKAYREVLGCV